MNEIVMRAISEATGCEPSRIKPDSMIAALGLDSLALVTVATEITAASGRSWTGAELLNLFTATTIQDILDTVAAMSGDPRAASVSSPQ
jgi:hypothetical protein